MITYIEVSQELVTSGYVSSADADAAAVVLADALAVEKAKRDEAFALKDEDLLRERIAGLEIEASTDAANLNYVGQQVAESQIAKAREDLDEDEAIIEEAQVKISLAYRQAAAALLAAELINEANLDDVADAIAGVWVVDAGE